MMKKLLVVALLLACQKHDDTLPTSTVASTSAATSASATPLATIEPAISASAAPSAVIVDAGMNEAQRQRAAALSKEAEAMQLQMLKAFGGSSGVQGTLTKEDLPPVDLSSIAVSGHDAGRGGGDLKLGGGGGGAIRQGGLGGLNSLGPRDH